LGILNFLWEKWFTFWNENFGMWHNLSWPFTIWGIDIVGVLPRAPRGFRFLFIAIDTFTKWVEAMPVVNITQDISIKFLQSIIYKFSVPKWVLTDNRTQFKGEKFARCCADFSINHQASSIAHPQMIGQVEEQMDSYCKGWRQGCSMIEKPEEGIVIKSCPQYYRHCVLMLIMLQETPHSTWYMGQMQYCHRKSSLNQPG
jgi:hypothetical protein